MKGQLKIVMQDQIPMLGIFVQWTDFNKELLLDLLKWMHREINSNVQVGKRLFNVTIVEGLVTIQGIVELLETLMFEVTPLIPPTQELTRSKDIPMEETKEEYHQMDQMEMEEEPQDVDKSRETGGPNKFR